MLKAKYIMKRNDEIKFNSKFNRRDMLKLLGGGTLSLLFSGTHCLKNQVKTKPNFIIIFTDDQGYGDLGCYGAKGFTTPNIDKMATEGVRFTNFYVASPACSPSRAALLTGSYPVRVGIPGVLGPNSKYGLNPEEVTIADLLKDHGYATCCVGKWHLGDHPKLLPVNHGFDEFFGLPYSNDMWPINYDGSFAHDGKKSKYVFPSLIRGTEKVGEIKSFDDQNTLTTKYTEYALNFIEKNKEQPFFLYLAHSMPHVPLGVSDKFRGKSQQGMYGDVIMEIDWSVGEIMNALKKSNLDENTFVIFTSDNGPWLPFGDHAGSTGPLREGKGTTFEGGMREPCIMRWPGKIPENYVCYEMATTMDILPTIAKLVNAELPQDRVVDGKNIWPLISNESGAKSPHEAFFYHWPSELQAVRSGKWKLHFPHKHRHQAEAPGTGGYRHGEVTAEIELSLFDLENDIGETTNVASQHPEIVERLEKLAEEHLNDLKMNSRPAAEITD